MMKMAEENVQAALKQASAKAQDLLGDYQMFATHGQDQAVQQMFQSMAEDMQRHVEQLQMRLDFLSNHQNQSNQSN